MYLILQHGILFYPAIEKNKDGVTKLDDQTLKLTSQCADFNYDTNTLVVDICKREGTKEEHFIRIFHKQNTQQFQLENEKKYVRFFRNLILSVDYKPRRPGGDMNEESLSSLCVYDFSNSICSFYSQGSTRIV